MTHIFVDKNTIEETLKAAAHQIQLHFIREEENVYPTEALQQALANWLELSIESLVDDVLYHTLEGDRTYAFNRRAFELQMAKIQPIKQEQDKSQEPKTSDPETPDPEPHKHPAAA